MCRRTLASLVVALALAGSHHVTTAAQSAQSALYLVCELEDRSELFIVIENFGGMGAAVKHCVHFWRGQPRGVMN